MEEAATTAATAAPGERRYANHLRIGFNQFEFVLDFAQAYHGQPEFVHTQLVAAPAHVKEFVALLRDCLSGYERRYGEIAPATRALPSGTDGRL